MRNVTKTLQMLFVVLLTTLAFATQSMAQSTLMTQSFENGGSVPAGWATEVVSGGNSITFVTSTSWPSGYTAYNGTYLVMFNSFSVSGGVNRLKMTTPISTVGYTNVTVDFAWLESTGYAGVLTESMFNGPPMEPHGRPQVHLTATMLYRVGRSRPRLAGRCTGTGYALHCLPVYFSIRQ